MARVTSTASGPRASRTSATGTSITRSFSRSLGAAALFLCLAAGALSSRAIRADEDEVVGPLRESISAAAIIVEGRAGHAYTSWDGADPATIRTYTPFTVTRVLKGSVAAADILLRQSGGDVAGASAVMRGAEFADGEQAIVFLGSEDPADASYDVAGGRRGRFVVLQDATGRAVLDVRMGADASAYGRKEKAPGTGLARVPVELFEELAAGGNVEKIPGVPGGADPVRSSEASASGVVTQMPHADMAASARSGRWSAPVLMSLAVVTALIALGWSIRRRMR